MKNAKKKNGAAAKGKGRAALSAQQTIPYLSMHPDGVCKLPGGLYTKTVEYEDINYSVASTEDQTAIFSGWSSFLNYFDSSLPFQLSFINRRSHSRSRYQVNIPKADDNYNSVRDEFTGMLKNQIAKSNNGIERSKYITFGIPAEGIAEARPRLERVEADVMGNFKRLGVPSEPMDGRARLALLHSQMHPGSREPFRFSWKDIPQTGLGTKDFIAPDSLDFRQSRTFRIGQYWGAVSYLQIMASELSDKLLAEILELDAEMTVTMHIQTVDQLKAIKTIKGKISDIGKMKVEEQRKAVRSGYDPDILPPDLITFSKDAAELLADLQSRNERMFLLTFTVVNLAPTRQRLENDVFTVGGIAQKYNCALRRLDWQQEQGFVSSLALGYNEVEIQRGMTTSSTAIFIPFMTRELRMAGQALYYGMNALSHNVIMADRKKLKSANGMYLGSTGSGKSFAAKRELLNVFLTIPQDRIIVVDPMGEYAPLVRRLGGQVIEIAPDSPHHLNPMDVELNMAAGESPLSMKADFLLSLCELVVGGKEGLQPIEKTVIDRCVRLVYREQALGLETAKTPLLQDLYEELLRQPEPEARRVATALELYCTGSLNLFNHPTNVKTDSRVVCIVLKNMGENLRKIAMHITNEFVSQAVDQNFHEGAATWCYAYSDSGNEEPPVVEETPPSEPAPTITPGEGFSEDGNLVTRDLLYDAATNKQFITVETSGGNTFYIVIDYDKPVDEDGEQYHTYFLNMVDEADLLAALEAAGGELPACSCTEKCAPGAINTDCAVCAVNMTECAGTAPEPAPVTEPAEEPEPEPQQKSNTGTLLLILAVAVLGSGAGWYFKIYRPKHEKAAVPEEDYSEELVDYDDPEDDGPPWDEDDTESEDNE